MKKVSSNLLKAVGIICYFAVLGFASYKMNIERLMVDIQVFAGMFLVLGILTIERAYKKDSGIFAITGIELLVLSMHSLSIMHVITFFKYDLIKYLVISAGIFSLYYILKAIIIYTLDRRKALKNLSDISEIVKDEPVKKEAIKKNEKAKEKNTKQEETENKSSTKKVKQKEEKEVTNKKERRSEEPQSKNKGKTKTETRKKKKSKKEVK